MEEGIGKRQKSVISDTIYPIMPREPLIKELILFFNSCSTKGRAGTYATGETSNRDTEKSPPVAVG